MNKQTPLSKSGAFLFSKLEIRAFTLRFLMLCSLFAESFSYHSNRTVALLLMLRHHGPDRIHQYMESHDGMQTT